MPGTWSESPFLAGCFWTAATRVETDSGLGCGTGNNNQGSPATACKLHLQAILYLRSLKLRNTCAVAEGLENPLLPGEIFFTCPWCLFEQNLLCLCSRSPPLTENGFPLWSTCCHVESMCISEASLHFRRPAPTWSMRRGSHRQSKNDQMISPYLDMECGTGRRVDVKPTMVA